MALRRQIKSSIVRCSAFLLRFVFVRVEIALKWKGAWKHCHGNWVSRLAEMVNSAHLHFRIPRLPFRLQHDRKLHSVSSANGECLRSTRRFSREFRVMSWQISHCSHLSLNIELAIFISQAVIVIINHWALIFRREEFKDGEGSCVS